MSTTLFLRFVDENQCKTALETAGAYTPPVVDADDPTNILREEFYINAGHGWACDIVGVLYNPGTYDQDGNELTPPTPLPGWHVNYSGNMPDSLQPYLVSPTPVTPHRIFAGTTI